MSYIKMTVYSSALDVTSSLEWADEEEYRNAEEFLIGIGATRVPPKDAADKVADFYLATEEQFVDLGSYNNSVVEARPRTGPPRLDMDFYVEPAGGGGRVTWANEDDYQQARKFLIDIGVSPMPGLVPRYHNAEFLYFDTREQYAAFRAFVEKVGGKMGA
jgi:hypothetical protein